MHILKKDLIERLRVILFLALPAPASDPDGSTSHLSAQLWLASRSFPARYANPRGDLAALLRFHLLDCMTGIRVVQMLGIGAPGM